MEQFLKCVIENKIVYSALSNSAFWENRELRVTFYIILRKLKKFTENYRWDDVFDTL